MNSHPDHDEGDKDVGDVETHQGVLWAGEPSAHFLWKKILKKNIHGVQ